MTLQRVPLVKSLNNLFYSVAETSLHRARLYQLYLLWRFFQRHKQKHAGCKKLEWLLLTARKCVYYIQWGLKVCENKKSKMNKPGNKRLRILTNLKHKTVMTNNEEKCTFLHYFTVIIHQLSLLPLNHKMLCESFSNHSELSIRFYTHAHTHTHKYLFNCKSN